MSTNLHWCTFKGLPKANEHMLHKAAAVFGHEITGWDHIHAKLKMALHDMVNIKASSVHKEPADSTKIHYSSISNVSKETWKEYKTNPTESGPIKIITISVEACSTIKQELLIALEKGKKYFRNLKRLGFLKIPKVYIH